MKITKINISCPRRVYGAYPALKDGVLRLLKHITSERLVATTVDVELLAGHETILEQQEVQYLE